MAQKQPNALVRSAQQHKTTTAVVGTWFVLQILSGFVNSLTDLDGFFAWPYTHLVQWAPTSAFGKMVFFNLVFWPYVGLALLLFQTGRVVSRKFLGQVQEARFPTVLYSEEFAAAVESIDKGDVAENVSFRIEDLLFTVGQTIAVELGLRPKDYRLYFITEKNGEPGVSTFRLGHQFRLIEQGVASFDKLFAKRSRSYPVYV